MELTFTPPHTENPGLIASLLKQSYASLLGSDPEHWTPEVAKWELFDREVFEHPDTVGSCVFLSRMGDRIVGFGSYDPRGKPEFGIVGHNCILPEFRNRGFGKGQVLEILRRFKASGIRKAVVTSNDYPFFLPARRMYVACGFRKTGRRPWDRDPSRALIEYELSIEEIPQ